MLQRVLHRASCRGFTPYYYDLDRLAENANYHLFRHSRRQAHCLNHLYTVKPRPPGAMQLRTRGHQFELPAVRYEFNKRNFIVRSLFNYVCFHLYYRHVCISLYTYANVICIKLLLTYLLFCRIQYCVGLCMFVDTIWNCGFRNCTTARRFRT